MKTPNLFFAILILTQLTAVSQNVYHVSQNVEADFSTLSDLPNLQAGDSVLLHAGEIWRERLIVNSSGLPGSNIYFGRYGEGENPKIYGSIKAEAWTQTSVANVWQSGTSLDNFSDEYYSGRLFLFEDDSVSWGNHIAYDTALNLSANLRFLTEEFDYTVGPDDIHYLYSIEDPDIFYDAIEVTQVQRPISLNNNSYLEFNGIDVFFGRQSGYFGGYPAVRGATDVIFRNLYVGYTGRKGSGSAYGIVCFHSNTLIEKCTFSDNGRRAISINTYTSPEGGRKIENIIIRNNSFRRGFHTTGIDISTLRQTGDTIRNVYIYNNYFDDSEIPAEDIGTYTSNQIFVQEGRDPNLITGIYIVNNVFLHSTARHILFDGTVSHHIWNNTFVGHNPNLQLDRNPWGHIGCGEVDTLDIRNNIFYDNLGNNAMENNIIHAYKSENTVFSPKDRNLYYSIFPANDRNFASIDVDGGHRFYNTNEWNDYLEDFPDYDQNSPEPQDPLFVSYNNFNFRLTEDSPAVNAGEPLPLIKIEDPLGRIDTLNNRDILGCFRSLDTPSLGAYEYTICDLPSNPGIIEPSTKFKLVPNPTSGDVIILFTGNSPQGSIRVKIYNLIGQVLFNESFYCNQSMLLPLDVNNLESGLYYIEVKGSGIPSESKELIIIK